MAEAAKIVILIYKTGWVIKKSLHTGMICLY